jgi:hypothetical protein
LEIPAPNNGASSHPAETLARQVADELAIYDGLVIGAAKSSNLDVGEFGRDQSRGPCVTVKVEHVDPRNPGIGQCGLKSRGRIATLDLR